MLNSMIIIILKWFLGSYYFEEKQQLKFDPPCYTQRYDTVSNLISEELKGLSGKRVVEFGCAELRFFHQLKNIPAIEEIIEVDIDEELLNRFYSNLMPGIIDYVRLRKSPLTVKVFKGSVDEYDECLENTDIVVAIELYVFFG